MKKKIMPFGKNFKIEQNESLKLEIFFNGSTKM